MNDDLDPNLERIAQTVADALRATVPAEVAARHEALLRAAAGGELVGVPTRGRRRRGRRMLVGLAAAAALVVGLSSAAVAAEGAAPGDPLYGLDRAIERVRLALTFSDTARAQMQLELAAERLREADRLRSRGDRAQIARVTADAVRSDEDAIARSAGGSEDFQRHVRAVVGEHVGRLREFEGESTDTHADSNGTDQLEREVGGSPRPSAMPRPSGSEDDHRDGTPAPGATMRPSGDQGSGSAGGEDHGMQPRVTPTPTTASGGTSGGPQPTPDHHGGDGGGSGDGSGSGGMGSGDGGSGGGGHGGD